VSRYVGCLPALAFVPPRDVQEAFHLLTYSQPPGVDQLDEVTTYFDHTIGGSRIFRGDDFGKPSKASEHWGTLGSRENEI